MILFLKEEYLRSTWNIFLKMYSFSFGCTGSLLLHMGFLQCSEWGLLFAVVGRLLIAVASPVVEHGSRTQQFQQLRYMGFFALLHVGSSRTKDRRLAGGFLTTQRRLGIFLIYLKSILLEGKGVPNFKTDFLKQRVCIGTLIQALLFFTA